MKLDPSLEISPSKLHAMLQSSIPPVLIDVRSPELYQEWSILDSKNIPLEQLREMESFTDITSNDFIVTFCPSGNKSKTAAKILQEQGYHVLSLQGGLTAWNNVFDPIDIKIKDSRLNITQIRRIAKGCLSYMISLNDEAIVIDPAFNIQTYVNLADERGLEIKHILDTHLQADHVSGVRALAETTGATMHLSTQDEFKFDFIPLKENEQLKLGGQSVIHAIPTPGHTKGSTSYRIKDFGILTGDVLFVNGIGRPDLANKAQEFAEDLFETLLRKIMTLPPNMFVAPAHHGKFAQKHFHRPILSTVEAEKQSPALQLNRGEFVDFAVSSAQSIARPPAYDTIIQINRGELFPTKEEIQILETGPNKCAIN